MELILYHISRIALFVFNILSIVFFFSIMTQILCMQVDIEVKITAGTPLRKVVIHEVATSNPAWVIFDR